VAQLIVPESQVPGTTQDSPSTQMVQPPIPSQARPTPQLVPTGRSAVASQLPLPPVEQSRVPLVHGLPVSQLAPVVHSEQPSAPQRPATPQGVPTGRSSTLMHTGIVAPQSYSPRVHGSPVSQVAPAVQVEQPVPSGEQARPSPQPVPGGRSVLAMHTRAPVVQSAVPTVHGSPVSQVVPGRHSLQMPPLHVPVVPQGVPDGASLTMRQTGIPEPQSMTPWEHGLPVSQVVPGVQTVQPPASSHARPTSQGAPGGRSPVTMQVGVPEQLQVPV
jgi:hypothetical protein